VTAPTPPGSAPRFTVVQVRRRRAVALRASVALLVAIGLLFVVVFPVSAWLDQRASLDRSERRLEILTRERHRLGRAERLLTSEPEIERIARERYGMVRPGEQAWAALPGATTTTTTLPSAP
jgi:Septum formation initiator